MSSIPSDELLKLIANLASIVRTQNGNKFEDINALLFEADNAIRDARKYNVPSDDMEAFEAHMIATGMATYLHYEQDKQQYSNLPVQKLRKCWQAAKADAYAQYLSERNECVEEIRRLNELLRKKDEFISSFKFSVDEKSFYKDVSFMAISPHTISYRLPIDSTKSFIFADIEKRRIEALNTSPTIERLLKESK